MRNYEFLLELYERATSRSHYYSMCADYYNKKGQKMSYEFEIGDPVVIRLTAEPGTVLARRREPSSALRSLIAHKESSIANLYCVRVKTTAYEVVEFFEFELMKSPIPEY